LIAWKIQASSFVVVGGVRFSREYDQIVRPIRVLLRAVADQAKDLNVPVSDKQVILQERLTTLRGQAIDAIDAVPITYEIKVNGRANAIGTAMMIRDVILTGKKRVHYFDRYVNSDFFPGITFEILIESLDVCPHYNGRKQYLWSSKT